MPREKERAGAVSSPALSLLLLFFFAAEILLHAPLLRLPYYWDEAGYYIPAAYDFFRTGTLIPYSTLTNAHPPGLSLYLAAAWKLFGFAPAVTRVSMCFATAVTLCAVWSLTISSLQSKAAAGAVVLLTASYPVFFVQSTLAHADTLAASATLWGLVFALAPSLRTSELCAMAACFTAAAMTKEIAIGTPLALAAWELVRLLRARGSLTRERGQRQSQERPWARVAALGSPVFPLAAWFAYHRWRTGFAFGNPGYLRYNARATLAPMRILLALAHRALHLTAHLNLFVPVALALGSLLLPTIPGRSRLLPSVRSRLWLVILANALLFSVLGGALLTRYLLPVYPLVLLLVIAAVYARLGHWLLCPAAGLAAFAAALLLPPPYRVAPEDTLLYRDSILLEQHAIALVTRDYPHSTVLSAWPVTDALRKPELGYLRTPVAVASIDNFSLPALEVLAGSGESYSTAIIFSTKYDPPHSALHLPQWNEEADERYFDFHHDLSATAVASLLGGVVVWREQRGSQWAAVLRFNHPQLACASYNQKEAGAVVPAGGMGRPHAF